MVKTRLDYDILQSPEDEPIVFTGPPGRLTGRLPVRNVGPERAVLRHATFRGGAIAGEAAAPVRTTVLRPLTGANLRTRLAISPDTPPGDYECEVEIGGSVRPALLRVVEVIDVVVQPSLVLIENTPGKRITKRVLVSNRGNVPVTVGHPGGIALDDQRGECRVTRATYEALGRALELDLSKPDAELAGARKAGDVEGPVLSIERALGEWVRQGREHLAAMGVLGVRNVDGTTEIAPGTQEAVRFAFRIPKGLDQHTRYVGVYPLYDADISFVIVPGPGQATTQEDDDATRS
jgi:hypothetical protein